MIRKRGDEWRSATGAWTIHIVATYRYYVHASITRHGGEISVTDKCIARVSKTQAVYTTTTSNGRIYRTTDQVLVYRLVLSGATILHFVSLANNNNDSNNNSNTWALCNYRMPRSCNLQ
jgi:hypothetical protein